MLGHQLNHASSMYEINILKLTANFSLYVGHIALVVVM